MESEVNDEDLAQLLAPRLPFVSISNSLSRFLITENQMKYDQETDTVYKAQQKQQSLIPPLGKISYTDYTAKSAP